MFICLSSGASPRYRQDILRALAMPKGSELQFRYDLKWISPLVQDQLSKGDLCNKVALIVYIDQHDNAKAPELVPCRYATVSDVVLHGTTVSIVFALQEFAYAEDLTAFNNEVRAASAGTLPSWQLNGKIKGAYWLDIGQEPKTVVKCPDLMHWEKIVTQIAGYYDFADERSFYTIEAIKPVGQETSLSLCNGVYKLKPNQEYEIRTYHFHPGNTPAGTKLELATSGQSLAFTTNPSMTLDSRYDLKRVRLKTGSPPTHESATLTMLRRGPNGSSDMDFDLPLQIRGTFIASLGKGVLLGAFLAAPQIVAAFANPDLSCQAIAGIAIVSGILGLIAGIFAAFGLKKAI